MLAQVPHTNFASHKDTFQAALNSIFSGRPEETEHDIAKILAPTFTVTEGDKIMDFPAFVKHIQNLRSVLSSATVTTTHFVRDGAKLAERHRTVATLKDGSIRRGHVFQFMEIAEDGRIASIVEVVEQEP